MDFAFNFYALLLIYSGIITLILSFIISKSNNTALRWFSLLVFANAIYSVGYGFELASSTLNQVKFFTNLEYIGITALPLTWFLLSLNMSGNGYWYKKPINMAFLLLPPIVTLIMVWTNDLHHLYYKDLYMDTTHAFPMVVVVPGIGYVFYNIYFYALFLFGSFLLINKFRKADPIYKRQNYTIIIAAVIPAFGNMFYLVGIRPLGNLDFTPFSFLISITLIFLAIYRFRLFDVLPIAREKVLDLMQDGFMILNRKQSVIDNNAAFRKYVATDRIIGKEIKELFPNQPAFLDFLAQKISGKIDLRVETEKGSYDLEADIRYLDSDELNKEIIIVKFQDQTALRRESLKIKEQAVELQKLNQQKDRIFSIIAHDLRGPLVNLSEVLQMITTGSITTEEFKYLTPTLSKDISYTKDLLDNLLHWSRSQLKGFGISKEHFKFNSLLLGEISYHLPLALEKEIQITHTLLADVKVYADMLMVQAVVKNILNNAIKFSNKGGVITITSMNDAAGNIQLLIADNGIGMTHEIAEHIFGISNTSTRGTMNEKGTGLGLMICKEFMERNEGDIRVKSKKGKGTVFTITLPLSAKPVKD